MTEEERKFVDLMNLRAVTEDECRLIDILMTQVKRWEKLKAKLENESEMSWYVEPLLKDMEQLEKP